MLKCAVAQSSVVFADTLRLLGAMNMNEMNCELMQCV